MEDQIRAFLELLEKGKSYAHNTVEAYRNDLTQFLNFALSERPQLTDWAQVDKPLLVAFLTHLKEREYTPASVARKIAVIKTFCNYLSQHSLIAQNPAIDLDSPKVVKRLPRILTSEELDRLLAAPAGHSTPKGMRDRAILELLYASGLRVTELVSLDVDDASLEGKTVHSPGPDGKRRLIPISDRAAEALGNYLQRGRPAFASNPDEPALFINPRGKRLTRQGLWLIIKEYVKEAQVTAQVTPHTLRHSFAAHLLRLGENLENVQHLLGHSNITTTQVYARLKEKDSATSTSEPWSLSSNDS